LRKAPCEPKPVQTPLPLLVGGGGERRTLRVAARFADEWHAWATPDEFRHKSAVLDRHCEDLGRDPKSMRRLTGAALRLVASARSPADLGADATSSTVLAGTPEMVVDRLGAYHVAGVDEFVLRDDRASPTPETVDELSLFSTSVAPHLR